MFKNESLAHVCCLSVIMTASNLDGKFKFNHADGSLNNILSNDPFIPSTRFKSRQTQKSNENEKKCEKCNNICSSYVTIQCEHKICSKCFYETLNQTELNYRNQGYIKCPICNDYFTVNNQIKLTKNSYASAEQKNFDFSRTEFDSIKTGVNYPYCGQCASVIKNEKIDFCNKCSFILCVKCFQSHRCRNQFNDENRPLSVSSYANFNSENRFADIRDIKSPDKQLFFVVKNVLENARTELRNYECPNHPGNPVQFNCISCKTYCICARCCVGPDSLHGKGHVIMDLDSSWEIISFEIEGAEKGRRYGQLEEYSRLIEMNKNVVNKLQKTMKLIVKDLSSNIKYCESKLNDSIKATKVSINETFDYVRKELLEPNLAEARIRQLIPAIFSLKSVMKSQNHVTLARYFNKWHEKFNNFPPSTDETLFICSTMEAKLAKAKYILRWIQENIALQHRVALALSDKILKSKTCFKLEKLNKPIVADTVNLTKEESLIKTKDMRKIIDNYLIQPMNNSNFLKVDQIENRIQAEKSSIKTIDFLKKILQDVEKLDDESSS